MFWFAIHVRSTGKRDRCEKSGMEKRFRLLKGGDWGVKLVT